MYTDSDDDLKIHERFSVYVVCVDFVGCCLFVSLFAVTVFVLVSVYVR